MQPVDAHISTLSPGRIVATRPVPFLWRHVYVSEELPLSLCYTCCVWQHVQYRGEEAGPRGLCRCHSRELSRAIVGDAIRPCPMYLGWHLEFSLDSYGLRRGLRINNVSHDVVGTDYGSFTYTNLPRSTLWARTPSPFGSLCAL